MINPKGAFLHLYVLAFALALAQAYGAAMALPALLVGVTVLLVNE